LPLTNQSGLLLFTQHWNLPQWFSVQLAEAERGGLNPVVTHGAVPASHRFRSEISHFKNNPRLNRPAVGKWSLSFNV
jgi:hypothetical protein